MVESEAQRALEGTRLEMPRNVLQSIQDKTGFNDYSANQGVVKFLERLQHTVDKEATETLNADLHIMRLRKAVEVCNVQGICCSPTRRSDVQERSSWGGE